MKIDILVQARIGSKRLPGKVLMPIMGRPNHATAPAAITPSSRTQRYLAIMGGMS